MAIVDQQLKSNDCGISAIKTVYNIFGRAIDRDYIQDHITLDEKGSSMADLKTFFDDNGCQTAFKFLDVTLLRNDPSAIKKLFPFILPIQKKNVLHYVVVNGIRRDKLRIYDPARQRPYYVSVSELRTMAFFTQSYWELVDLEDHVKALCGQELSKYDITVNGALDAQNFSSTFNKLAYFAHVRDHYGFKNDKAETAFLEDLLHNHNITALPEQFIQLTYQEGKIRMSAPLVLSISSIPEEKITYETTEAKPNIYLKLFRELGTHKRLWYIYLVTGLFAALVTQLAVFVNQILIDYVLPSFQLNILVLFAVGFAIFRVLDLLIHQYKRFVAIHVGNLMDQYFLTTFNQKLNRFSLKYAQTFRKGDLTERLSDAMKLKSFFIRIFSSIIIDSFVAIVSLVLLFFLHSTLTLLICGVIVLFILWFRFITPYLQFNEQKRFIIKANYISKMIERIEANQVIKCFRLDSLFSNRIRQNIGDLINIYTKTKYIDLINTSVISVIATIAYTLIVVIITRDSIFATQTLTVGSVITFIMLSERVFSTLGSILEENLSLRENEIILKRYFDFNEPLQFQNRNGITDFTIHHITLKDISFGYDPKNLILKDINFQINQGERIKIEGSNGSGKSSLCKVISFLYDADAGDILINDKKDIFYDRNALADKVLLVSNEDILFNDTLLFNISLGRNIPHSSIIDLAKEIDLYDFIAEHQEGLHFQISENGKNLSTGQRKKILIMRALLNEAELIILDEVLSGIDLASREKTERLIQDLPGKTFILISHEPIRHLTFDQKLVLTRGELSHA